MTSPDAVDALLKLEDGHKLQFACPTCWSSPLTFDRVTFLDRGRKGAVLHLYFICPKKHTPVYRIFNGNGSGVVIESNQAWPRR